MREERVPMIGNLKGDKVRETRPEMVYEIGIGDRNRFGDGNCVATRRWQEKLTIAGYLEVY